MSLKHHNIQFTELNDRSTAYDLSYRNSTLFCCYQDSRFGKNYQIEIECPIERPSFYSMAAGGLRNCAKTKIVELSYWLDIDEHGKYRLKKENGLVTLKFGAVLAIGLYADKYKYLASVTTDIGLVYFAVPVMSERAIKVRQW